MQACCCHAAPFSNWIDGNVNLTRQDAFFGGLKHCDSPNHVLCAPRRAEEDRQLLTVALAQVERLGYQVYHAVFTLAHHWRMTLESQRAAMNDTLAAVFSGRWFEAFKAKFGYIGRIRATESPFGENGWHVHTHVPVILDPAAGEYADQDAEKVADLLKAYIWPRYQAELEKNGFTADQEHGLTLQVGHSTLAAYVAKYGRDPALGDMNGLENEVTGFFSKTDRYGSLTPFELLAASLGDDAGLLARLSEVSQRHYSEAQLIQLASELFIEYFKTFKGKPRLVWSKGLWEALGMDEAWDWFQLAQKPDEVKTLVQLEPQEGWKKLRGGDGGEDLRPELLAELVTGDLARVKSFCERHSIEAAFPDGTYTLPEIAPPPRELLEVWEETTEAGFTREQQKWFGGHAVPGGASVPFATSSHTSAPPDTLSHSLENPRFQDMPTGEGF